jgi:hypothetical protein
LLPHFATLPDHLLPPLLKLPIAVLAAQRKKKKSYAGLVEELAAQEKAPLLP